MKNIKFIQSLARACVQESALGIDRMSCHPTNRQPIDKKDKTKPALSFLSKT